LHRLASGPREIYTRETLACLPSRQFVGFHCAKQFKLFHPVGGFCSAMIAFQSRNAPMKNEVPIGIKLIWCYLMEQDREPAGRIDAAPSKPFLTRWNESRIIAHDAIS
jgi:hypothetical protein